MIDDNSSKSLVEIFAHGCERTLDEKGIFPHHLVWTTDNTRVYVCFLEVPPEAVVNYALDCLLTKGATELVFGLDTQTRKENQGVETDDLLAVFHFNYGGWHYGVIEYQYEPRIWKDIDWENEFWCNVMESEVIKFFERSILKTAE